MNEKLLKAGTKVCLSGKPGKIGVTTGKFKKAGSITLIQVAFGPTEITNKPANILVVLDEDDDIEDLFVSLNKKHFGSYKDLRKILIYNKINGELTNIFYSMEIGDTDFYSHQFKPVLKFIESHVGRLLIADEVGLGKTIEAIYIWKEMQARQSARRMLIVCPAMLRSKWKGELKARFGLRASIVNAKEIYNELSELKELNDHNRGFIHIISLEGVRTPSDFQENPVKNNRAKLGNLLVNHSTGEDLSLYDLVVFDEAHYLRNQSTASNLFARLIRDVSENMLFLTATPIQTSSENLYQLLKLVDLDQFYDTETFLHQVDINAPLIKIANLLRRSVTDTELLKQYFVEVEEQGIEEQITLLNYIKSQFSFDRFEQFKGNIKLKMKLCRLIESNQLLNRYMSRTRKRDVIENRVIREANAYQVTYSEYELQVYERMSSAVRKRAEQTTNIPIFVLITRQRQMASSLVAAIEGWQESGLYEDLEEFMWEDQGIINEQEIEVLQEEYDNLLPQFNMTDIDLDKLREQDSKYLDLIKAITMISHKYPGEKIIIFAYFRKTLSYLEDRLQKDRYQTFQIKGGMGEEKYEIIDRFKNYNKQAILLSSEVGSEGIDLQFCRIIINYDLPWNPMRVEQRIGRIDRLGQKADRINIINFTNEQTIEDRILKRLYERVEVFKRSIGDLENIIGDLQTELMNIIYDPKLSEKEKEDQALQTIKAKLENRLVEQQLEDNAVNLLGFSDYILKTINESKENNRWIDGSDLIIFIEDFFRDYYTDTRIEQDTESPQSRRLLLSKEAKLAFSDFIFREKPHKRTNLNVFHKFILCIFNQKIAHLRGSIPPRAEFVDTSHPLILWIKSHYSIEEKSLFSVSAIKVSQSDFPKLKNTMYGYVIQKWEFVGITRQSMLRYSLNSCDSDTAVSLHDAEQMLNRMALVGKQITNIDFYVDDFEEVEKSIERAQEFLNESFGEFYGEIELENNLFCDRQLNSAISLYKRKSEGYLERIGNLEISDDPKKRQLIPALKGLIAKEEHDLELKKRKVESRRIIDANSNELSIGFVFVDTEN